MPRFALPRVAISPTRALPPELRWDAPRAAAVGMLLSRRQFLKALGIVLAASAAPWTRAERAWAARRGRFLTGHERATVKALCNRVIPRDGDPGGAQLGAHAYVERLLTAFDVRTPFIFAGGPFSNRNPFPDNARGVPSRKRPRNAFDDFIPLTREQELEWRAELYGSTAVPEVAALDAQFGGPLVGLRQLYRSGLAKVDEVARATHGKPFTRLTDAQQDDVFELLDSGAFAPDPRRDGRTFMDVLIRHTLEGCFAAPEYGGNRRGRGWKMLGLEGDSQPLGYSVFSRATASYNELAEHPMSTPNPDEVVNGVVVPRPLSADGQHIQTSIAAVTAGFADGRC